jgi:hypothetical protein
MKEVGGDRVREAEVNPASTMLKGWQGSTVRAADQAEGGDSPFSRIHIFFRRAQVRFLFISVVSRVPVSMLFGLFLN